MCIFVLISDLFTDPEQVRAAMARIKHRRHDLIVFQVLDRAEQSFDFADAAPFETGGNLRVDEGEPLAVLMEGEEGRVSFHSDALHIVERYRRVDANTLEIEATLEDPKVLTKPWIVPKQTLVLAPFDQIMELACSNETQSVMEGASKQNSAKK